MNRGERLRNQNASDEPLVRDKSASGATCYSTARPGTKFEPQRGGISPIVSRLTKI